MSDFVPAVARFRWMRFVAWVHLATFWLSLAVLCVLAVRVATGPELVREALLVHAVPAGVAAGSAFGNLSAWAVLRLMTDQAEDIRALARMAAESVVDQDVQEIREATASVAEAVRWGGLRPAGEEGG